MHLLDTKNKIDVFFSDDGNILDRTSELHEIIHVIDCISEIYHCKVYITISHVMIWITAISTLQRIHTDIGMGPLMEIRRMQIIPNDHAYL